MLTGAAGLVVAETPGDRAAEPTRDRSSSDDLEELRKIAARTRASVTKVTTEIRIDSNPSKGSEHAKLALVAFSDYQCPHCKRYLAETMPSIEKNYIATGKLRYYSCDFPMEAKHSQAFKAAEAARCAAAQAKYWEMHELLFIKQKALHPEFMSAHAGKLGLDSTAFEQCLARSSYAQAVRDDIALALRLRVRGTPTFFLGIVDSNNDRIIALRRIVGAQPYQVFRDEIDALLEVEATALLQASKDLSTRSSASMP